MSGHDFRYACYGLPSGDEVRKVVDIADLEKWAEKHGERREDMSLEDIAEALKLPPITYFELD